MELSEEPSRASKVGETSENVWKIYSISSKTPVTFVNRFDK